MSEDIPRHLNVSLSDAERYAATDIKAMARDDNGIEFEFNLTVPDLKLAEPNPSVTSKPIGNAAGLERIDFDDKPAAEVCVGVDGNGKPVHILDPNKGWFRPDNEKPPADGGISMNFNFELPKPEPLPIRGFKSVMTDEPTRPSRWDDRQAGGRMMDFNFSQLAGALDPGVTMFVHDAQTLLCVREKVMARMKTRPDIDWTAKFEDMVEKELAQLPEFDRGTPEGV